MWGGWRRKLCPLGKSSYVMLFVSVSSVCTLMFMVLEWIVASYFVEWYVWSCVMFEKRFTLCIKVVGEFSNVAIYVFVFYLCWSPGLASFPFATMSKVLCVSFWLPHRSSAWAIWCGLVSSTLSHCWEWARMAFIFFRRCGPFRLASIADNPLKINLIQTHHILQKYLTSIYT